MIFFVDSVGLQLHHLTPNSILHVSIFITLCECFLGVHPNWALWKRIFYLRRNGSHNIAYNIGGVVICVRPDVEYFNVKFPDSVQGWRKRWLYVREECRDSLEYNIAPLTAKFSRRRSRDAEATEEEKRDEALMSRIHELRIPAAKSCRPLMQPFINLGTQFIGYRNTVNGLKEALLAADKRAEDLASKLKASEEASEKPEKDASCIEDLRNRLHEAETALTDKITQHVAREGNVAFRLESLNRRFVNPNFCFSRKMSQDFVLEKPEDDRILDALSLLEIHADLVRRTIFDAHAAFSRLFPYFFPKKKEPDTFAALAKSFVPKKILGFLFAKKT
ncbi:hypothetical protein QYE76_042192 [Lolium multiflorum]|uniref:Transposase (putative) gypsy type domain-containing protein n=1 Tax=Lolium multiflorum TaxID=4521 RepID=A0AAD8TGG8_LOLMU|nr:hypothetical protein QYE76_042192 [Lolium multiflorum]